MANIKTTQIPNPRWFLVTLTYTLTFVSVTLTPGVECYSSGAPPTACGSMEPGHGGSLGAYGNKPFDVISSSVTYGPLELITGEKVLSIL